jgi:hypothetical protein
MIEIVIDVADPATLDLWSPVSHPPGGCRPAIDVALRKDGFARHDPDLDGYGYRYERDGNVVDVLAPDGIKPPPTLGAGVTAVGVPEVHFARSRRQRAASAAIAS